MQPLPNQSFALIAHADAKVRATLSEAVGQRGLASVPVHDGRQAIRMLADLHPSVVVLHAQMPGLGGVEVCWWIRRHPRLAETPVILISAQASEFEIDAGLLAGANSYLTTPLTSARFTAVVAHHLAGRPLLPPPARVVIVDPSD